SGGPSISTMSGRCSARAARTDRADPGPWCLTPYSVTGPAVRGPLIWAPPIWRRSSGDVTAGAVEIAPLVPVPDDGLQVLLPHRAVRDRILHDGAGDAAGHIGGAQHAVAEVRGQRQAAGDHGDRLGGGQRAARRLDPGPAVLGDALAQLAED